MKTTFSGALRTTVSTTKNASPFFQRQTLTYTTTSFTPACYTGVRTFIPFGNPFAPIMIGMQAGKDFVNNNPVFVGLLGLGIVAGSAYAINESLRDFSCETQRQAYKLGVPYEQSLSFITGEQVDVLKALGKEKAELAENPHHVAKCANAPSTYELQECLVAAAARARGVDENTYTHVASYAERRGSHALHEQNRREQNNSHRNTRN